MPPCDPHAQNAGPDSELQRRIEGDRLTVDPGRHGFFRPHLEVRR